MAPAPGPDRSNDAVSGAIPAATADQAVHTGRFDRWASHYERSQLQHMLYEPVHHKVLARARQHSPQPSRVLDIGCGTGRLTRSCVRCFPDGLVIGIDPCAAMIRQADTAPPPIWLQARAEALPFADHTFDLILSTMSLRHWQDPPRGLAEMSRVTTTDGKVIIADALTTEPLTQLPARTAKPPLSRVPLLSPGHPKGGTSRRATASVLHAVRQAGLRTEQVDTVVLALATVTLIIAAKGRR